MTVGFQCFNTAGAFQIDGVYPQFVLKRKVAVTCSVLNRASSTVGHRLGDFDLASNEIAAIISNTPCAITRVSGGKATMIVPNASPLNTATAYVFGTVSTVASSFGFQVFNASGTLVFDAAQKPLAMVGFPTGEGNFTYDASKTYAVLCTNQYLQIVSTGHDFGSVHRVVTTMGMVRAIAGGINISNVLIYDDSEQMDPGTAAADESVPAVATNRHIIIDVTNY